MITISHINGVVSDKDLKKIPTNYVAKHSTGNEWIFFETKEEYEQYKLDNFPKQEEILSE